MNGREVKTVSFRFQLFVSALLFFVLIYHLNTSTNMILKIIFAMGFISNLIGTFLLLKEYKKRRYRNN